MTKRFNPVFADRPKTIFAVMSELARECGAINLGQGFPDEDGPQALLETAARAICAGPNQYAPVEGLPELREAVADANKRFYGLAVDWRTQTIVTVGATEALAASFFAFLNPGDDALLIAPCYDSYAPIVEAAGARVVYLKPTPPSWRIEKAAIEAAITPRTRVIVVNTPNNPTGRVYSLEELQAIADIAIDRDLIVICDEVYEHLVFDGVEHTPLMKLDGMLDRCVRIGSAGKTFSMTGWRIGYATGSRPLINGLLKAHQFITYTCPPHLQIAVAEGLRYGDDYFERFVAKMQSKRDFILKRLKEIGFGVIPCEGTYFATVDIAPFGRTDDASFCEEITRKAKVTAVPVSAFYPRGGDAPRNLARFCFCKKLDVLEEAMARLQSYLG